MTPSESTKLIETAGGIDKFAELLGLTSIPHYKQLVTNWRRRGIPSRVELQNHALIQKLSKQKANA